MPSAVPMYPHSPKSGLRPILVGIALICFIVAGLSSVARAQLEVSESEVSEGDFNVVSGDRAKYKFVIKATKTGTTKAEAEVKPYWYIIYATGIDIYGNPFYEQLAQGRTSTLYGQVTGTGSGGGTEAETQTFEGSWGTSDPTLLNYYPLRPRPTRYSAHQIAIRLYGDGDTAADPPADDAAFIAPDLRTQKGSIYFYNPETPDLAIPLGGVTYNAGTYDGGDIIRMTTTWQNNGGIILTPGETYKVHNYLTENAAIEWRPPTDPLNPDDTVKPPSDDYLLSEYAISGDRPVKSEMDPTPIIPDAGSIIRKVEASPLPSLTTYGILNRSVTSGVSYYGSTLRVYQPQSDDGYLDVGEVVSVTVEVKIPENYAGTYFVAARVDPENSVPEPESLFSTGTNPKLFMEIQDPALKRADNNSFVSNASAKITIDGPTTSPVIVEAVSAIAEQDGQYIQGGGETSNQSSPSADGTIVAFSSLARNLLVPPPLAEAFIAANGRGANMAEYPDYSLSGYGAIGDYLTTKQQIFYRLRDTRENYLASALNGVGANADCFNPSISSASGRYIAFDSRASNLGAPNTATRSLIYISDTKAQSVSALLPDANGDCFNPSISANGRFVAFESVATNLDPAKPIPANNSWQQIYLHDRDSDGNGKFDETGSGKTATYLVSVNDAGKVSYGGKSLTPVVSTYEKDKTGADYLYVAYVSYAGNLPTGPDVIGNNNEQVYRVKVNVGSTGGASTVERVSVNDNGDIANKPQGAPNGSIEPSISGDGSQVAFSSSANNLVYNPSTGIFDADTNFVSDVFVRDFNTSTTVRVSVSNERVATGTITFSGPSLLLVPDLNFSLVNIPQNNPQPGDTLTITSGGVTQTFVFGTDVPIGPDVPVLFPETVGVLIGQDACATRDNLVNAINASGLGIVASATTATSLPASLGSPVHMAISPSIYLRSVETGDQYNGTITFVPSVPPAPGVDPVVTDTDLTGGGTQAEDAPLVDPADPTADPAVQRVLAGSNQPSISEDGRVVAFRSIAYNLDVQTLTPENNIDGGPPYTDIYPPSPRQGELIRPIRFPASNIYVHNRAVDPGLSFDTPGNLSTAKVSLNKFGYPTTISAGQATGVGAWTTAASQAPAVGGDGRVITFSSGSEVYGGLAFGRSNLDPLDFQNARDVYLYDAQTVGQAPPPSASRPDVALLSPLNGLSVQVGSTISLAASAVPNLGKTIASVQFYVNGTAIGDPFTAEPYALTYTLQNAGQYIVRVVATDSRGIKNTAFATVIAKTPPDGQRSPSVSITQPSGITGFVVGSEIALNVLATDVDGDDTVNPDLVFFYVNGVPFKASRSALVPNTYFSSFTASKPGTLSIFAQATDKDGNTSVSVPISLGVEQPQRTVPSVEILSLLPGTPTPANGLIPLRAEVDLAGADPESVVVQFLANGAVVGTGTLQENGAYLLLWKTPSQSGAFTVTARVLAVNAVLGGDGTDEKTYYAAVRSRNFIIVNTANGVAPSVELVSPLDGSTASVNQALTLRAAAGGLPGVASVTVNNGGSGYTNVPAVTLPKPGVSAITVVDGGNGYTNPPTVLIAPPVLGDTPNTATAVAILGSGPTAGQVIRIDMIKLGSGYTTNNLPSVTITNTNGGAGSGAIATAVVVPASANVYMAPTNIASIGVLNPGTNYTAAPNVIISGGGGSGAKATAVLGSGPTAGQVIRIDMDNRGSNYTHLPEVTFSGGGGSNASAAASFSNAVVSNIIVTETGSGYSTAAPLPTVSLSGGGGSGAVATAKVGTPTVASVQFYVNGLPYGVPDTTQPYETTYTPVSQGSYIFSAVAIGADGLMSEPDESFVAVSRGAAPTVEIKNPTPNIIYLPGTIIPVAASAEPATPGGRIASVQFFVDGVSLGLPDTQAPFVEDFVVPGSGPYKITAVATDTFGNVGLKTVEIQSAAPQSGGSPVISINYPRPNPLTLVPGSQIFINAVANVPDGRELKEIRFYVDGSREPNDNPKSGTYLYRQLDNDDHSIVAEVVDSAGYASFSVPLFVRAQSEVNFQEPKINVRPVYLPTARAISEGTTVYLVADVALNPLDYLGFVDFYANGFYIGSIANSNKQTGTFTAIFPWIATRNDKSISSEDINVRAAARAVKRDVGVFVDGEPVFVTLTDDYSVLSSATDSSTSFSVTKQSNPPTIEFLSPSAGAKFSPNTQIFVSVKPQVAPGRSVKSVQFYVNGEPVGEDTNAPYSLTYPLETIGAYLISAAVVDNTSQTASANLEIEAVEPSGSEPVVVLTQPLPERNYVFGSVLPLNMSVTDDAGVNTNSIYFLLNGAPLKAKNGFGDIYTGQYVASSTVPSLQIASSATDLSGNTTVSGALDFQFAQAQALLPTITTVPLDPSAIAVAGGLVQLRAKASFPTVAETNNSTSSRRVEFFADNVFIGVATNNTNTLTANLYTHTFDWRTPTNTADVSYSITARAVALNTSVPRSGTGSSASSTDYFASVFSPAPIAVNVGTNSPPGVSITQPATNGAQLGQFITSQVVASVTNLAPNASAKEVQFYVDGALVASDTAFPYIFDWTPMNPGIYSLAAVVVDNFGLQGTSAVRTVSVVSGTPPSVAIISPVATDQFFSGEKFTIAAAASGNGATITRVEFFVNGLLRSAVTDSFSPFTFDYTPPAPGTYSIYARATDSRGNVKDSASVNIVVQGINPNDPVIQGKVLQVYQKLLSRVPTAAENQYWVGALSGGTTESTMITQLMGTAEYNDYQNKLLGYYYKLNVAPVNSTYLQQLGYMAIDRGALPPPANYPPQGPSNLAPSYGAVNGDARVAKAIVDSPAFNSANPGVQFYGDQQFMVWYFGQWPYGILGSSPDLVAAMGASQFKQGYAAAFINALAYAARDTSAFDYQLKATSFLWLYYGVWQKNTTPAVSTAAQLKAYIQTLLGEPVVTTRPLSPKLSAGAASLSRFTTTQGTPSLPKQFSVAGEDLAGQVTIAADPGFEVSTDGVNYSQTLQLSPQTTGTAVQVRVSTTAAIGSLRKSVRVLAEGVPTCTVQVSAQVKRPKKGKAK